jgi:transcriptional regulator with XRE-family HTH domain
MRTLLDLRKAAGLSGMAAAERAGFSQAKISRIEKGVNHPTPRDVELLATVYGASPEQRRHLTSLAEDVKATYRRVVLPKRANRAQFQERMQRVEASSTLLREFSPVVIPGYLQTADYMRAVFTTSGTAPEDAERAVAARLRRQEFLVEPGRRVEIITTEGALGWAAGCPDMMIAQLEHVAETTRLPRVRVGIIPFGTPRAVWPPSNFNLYDERTVVPGMLRAQVVLEQPDVAPYVELFASLLRLAAFDDDARGILAAAIDRYRGMRAPEDTSAVDHSR